MLKSIWLLKRCNKKWMEIPWTFAEGPGVPAAEGNFGSGEWALPGKEDLTLCPDFPVHTDRPGPALSP